MTGHVVPNVRKATMEPVIEATVAKGATVYTDELASYNDIAPRSAIVEHYTKLAADVTDDNMLVEWKNPLRYPD